MMARDSSDFEKVKKLNHEIELLEDEFKEVITTIKNEEKTKEKLAKEIKEDEVKIKGLNDSIKKTENYSDELETLISNSIDIILDGEDKDEDLEKAREFLQNIQETDNEAYRILLDQLAHKASVISSDRSIFGKDHKDLP